MRTLVLDVPLSDTDTLDAFADALVAAGQVLGAPFAHAAEDAHAGAEMQRFLSPGGATVELVDDYDARARYVEVLALDPIDQARLVDLFARALPVVPLDRLVDDARAHVEAFPGVLLRLALGAPTPPAPEVVAAVEAGLGHAREDVRLAAVEAVGMIGLPPFAEAMQRLRTSDPHPDVRAYADETFRRLHG